MGKLDILDREKFVEDLLRVVENISENKSSTCFALNGEWGCGKSFVLDMFEKKLGQKSDNKYFVIRYNCWKNDYYAEPLEAIATKIIRLIEEKIKTLSTDKRKQEDSGNIKGAMISILNDVIKARTGINAMKTYRIWNREEDVGENEKEQGYDYYITLDGAIDKLREALRGLALEQTVIIIVDELDRCLPEYAIKVLERLHHLTEETKNIITIVAIDKKQLMSSVKHAFGFENPEKYLEKFVSFEIKLDNGIASDKIVEKYASYIDMFDKTLFTFDDSIEECLQGIFKDIDIRTQEQIVKKAMLVHKLLYTDKKDFSFMCMELILAIMMFVCNENIKFSKRAVDERDFQNVFLIPRGIARPSTIRFLGEKFERTSFIKGQIFAEKAVPYILPNKNGLYEAILFTWYLLYAENSHVIIRQAEGSSYKIIAQNSEELKKYVETMHIMR